MTVESVKYSNPDNTQVEAVIDEQTYFIPCDEANRYWRMILDWQFGEPVDVDGYMVRPTVELNPIEPYVAPREE